jgi:hypothetical protein
LSGIRELFTDEDKEVVPLAGNFVIGNRG